MHASRHEHCAASRGAPSLTYFAGGALDQRSQRTGHRCGGSCRCLLLSFLTATLLLDRLIEPTLDLQRASGSVGPFLVEMLVGDFVVVSDHLI